MQGTRVSEPVMAVLRRPAPFASFLGVLGSGSPNGRAQASSEDVGGPGGAGGAEPGRDDRQTPKKAVLVPTL